ncbi:ClpP/crotonase-like domain-containing protein [Ilyonectria destructans]|nr:ClpP/crotonase-like domain-containing protein [Ilyonectria destructans]
MISSRLLNLALATTLFPATLALQLPEYKALKTSLDSNILTVTFHNRDSPVNLWNQDTQDGVTDLVERLQHDNETKVVIFNSDVPRFFTAHLDLSMPSVAERTSTFATLMYNITTLHQVTIGAVEGRARGAGNEFLVALDMRFATKNDTFFGQPEVGTGLFPGGGGSQFLPGLIGRGRAMEYILSSNDITAADAEKIGWINKAFDTSADMYTYIDQLTSRLRLFPLTALYGAKKSINRASTPSFEDIVADGIAFREQLADPLAQAAARRSAALLSNQSQFDVELNLPAVLPALYL